MTLNKLWPKNKQVIVVAASIFIISLTTILFFTPGDNTDLKTNLLGYNPALHRADTENVDYALNLEDPANPYFVLNRDGEVIYSDEAFSAMLDKSSEDVDGLFLFDFIVKEDESKVFKYFRDVSDSKNSRPKAGPFKITTENQEYIVFLSFIALPEHGYENVLIEVDDVTERINNIRTKDDLEKMDSKYDDNSRISMGL